MTEPVSRERQMARLETLGRLAKAIEDAVTKHRDFTREELSDGAFVAQILLAISKANVAFYLDEVEEDETYGSTPTPGRRDRPELRVDP